MILFLWFLLWSIVFVTKLKWFCLDNIGARSLTHSRRWGHFWLPTTHASLAPSHTGLKVQTAYKEHVTVNSRMPSMRKVRNPRSKVIPFRFSADWQNKGMIRCIPEQESLNPISQQSWLACIPFSGWRDGETVWWDGLGFVVLWGPFFCFWSDVVDFSWACHGHRLIGYLWNVE